MNNQIIEVNDKNMKLNIATKVLNDLPEWFGIETSTLEYIHKSSELPFFAIYDDQDVVGFVSLKETSPYTIEIYCMGILKSHHRNGLGKILMDRVFIYAKDQHYRFIQVKTVKQGTYDTYDKTNAFYKSLGFYELEVFPTLWDEWNPCQVYVKSF